MMVWSVCFTIDRVVYPDISPKAPPTSQQMGQFPPNTVIHLKIKQNKNPVLSSSSTGEDLLSTNQRQSSPKLANIPRARQQEPTKFVEKSRARRWCPLSVYHDIVTCSQRKLKNFIFFSVDHHKQRSVQ